ncbi:hypothetical protein, partial [Pseudomonas sp. Ag1]|uniref:hypothetical protein n=1 Tax=Pseudomonas sp. Ag1 TaxID=1197727 RepID=UPI001EE681BB
MLREGKDKKGSERHLERGKEVTDFFVYGVEEVQTLFYPYLPAALIINNLPSSLKKGSEPPPPHKQKVRNLFRDYGLDPFLSLPSRST